MTDAAAKGAAPAVPRARNTIRRLVQYLLLQAAIAVLCILALRHPLREPPPQLSIQDFTLTDRGETRPVTLPAFAGSHAHAPTETAAVFTGSFDWRASDAEGAWSVYLPRFTNGVAVLVNGTEILDSRRDPAANRSDRATPEIATIPVSLLHEGKNEITIRLFVWGPISGFLDRLYVGPDRSLRPYYERRTLIFVTLPVVFAAWQGILAVILAVMWAMRRGEAAYGALAAAMALGAIQAFLLTAIDQPAHPEFNATLLASAPLESACVLAFGILFFLRRWPRLLGAQIFLPGALLVLVGLFGDPAAIRKGFVILGLPSIGLDLVLLAAIVAWSEVRKPDLPSLLLGCGVTIVLISLLHDVSEVVGLIPDHRLFFTRLSYSAMLVAIGAGLTSRFARALNRVDGFAAHLAIQLREAEDKLTASFAREKQREREAALARERTRLMRDLHDGLGGQLVSIVALSERGTAGGIGDAARAALKDLRLVIDSMDDIGGDLMLALASWRDRVAAQLRPHDIALDWHAAPPGLPVYPELRPWHVVQIVRILDEAVTNAVKHANAKRISVRIETIQNEAGEARGCITVADDGKGFALSGDGAAANSEGKSGRGLANMRSRAARCGAELLQTSAAGGTSVRLILPHRFAEGDAAG